MKIILLLLLIIYYILAFNNCAYTSYLWYNVGESVGLDSKVCVGEVYHTDEYNHAWVRICGYNIETTLLIPFKSLPCNYENPHFISGNKTIIRELLFP